jgi:hypothetical protein
VVRCAQRPAAEDAAQQLPSSHPADG